MCCQVIFLLKLNDLSKQRFLNWLSANAVNTNIDSKTVFEEKVMNSFKFNLQFKSYACWKIK